MITLQTRASQTTEQPVAALAPPSPTGPKANLDFVRAFAVILVVIDHTCLALGIHRIGSWDPGWFGTLGVFIFFVHTSLVLMWSLERRPHLLDFYIRRVFRIYPLALLALTVAVVTHAPVVGSPMSYFGRVPWRPIDLLLTALLVQNLRLATPPMLNVMWTLPFEVQMYILLPALFTLARLSRKVWPIVLFWILSVAFCHSIFPDHNMMNLATVIPIFIPGVIAYVIYGNREPTLPSFGLSVLLVLITCALMQAPTNRKGWYLALALGLGLPLFRDIRSRLIVRASHEVAKYSYGIYLSHPFALVVGMYLLRGHSLWVQLAVELTVIAAASVGSYHLLELPMIRFGSRIAVRAEIWYEQATRNRGI